MVVKTQVHRFACRWPVQCKEGRNLNLLGLIRRKTSIPDPAGFNGQRNLDKENLGSNIKHIIEFLSFHNYNQEVSASTLRQLKDSEFEPLVVSNKNGEQSKIMVKIKDNMIREMVICHVDDEVAVVHLKGKIKPEDVAQVVNKHDDDR